MAEIDAIGVSVPATFSTANFAELIPQIGYDRASKLAKWMLDARQTWNDVVDKLNDRS